MKRLRTKLALVLGLSVAFLATGADAQKRPPKKPGVTAKPGGKKKGGKKPKKPKGKPVELGELDEAPPTAAPTTTPPAPSAAPTPPAAPPPTPPASVDGTPATSASTGEPAPGDNAHADGESASTASSAGTDEASRHISAALLLGAGFNGAHCGLTICNAYGFGFGLRGGYTLPMHVYVGGTFVYHFGFNKELPIGPFTQTQKGSVTYLGPEIGYDFVVGPVSVRPYAGLGLGYYSASITQNFGTKKGVVQDIGGAHLALWPGVLGLYPFAERFFAGVDLRFTIFTASENSFSFFATGGMLF